MSQIVTLDLDLSLEELKQGLCARGITTQVPELGRRMRLAVSAECVAEPVDLMCPAGSALSLEAWGFRMENGSLLLVCGEFDRSILQEEVIEPIRRAVALSRVQAAIAEVEQEAWDGEEEILPAAIVLHEEDLEEPP